MLGADVTILLTERRELCAEMSIINQYYTQSTELVLLVMLFYLHPQTFFIVTTVRQRTNSNLHQDTSSTLTLLHMSRDLQQELSTIPIFKR